MCIHIYIYIYSNDSNNNNHNDVPGAVRESAGPSGTYSQRKGKCSEGGSALYDICSASVKTLLVKCPSVQWQPDGLTIHITK